MKHYLILTALCFCSIYMSAAHIICEQDTVIKTTTTVTTTNQETGEIVTTKVETEKTVVLGDSKNESSFIKDGSSYNFIFSWKKRRNLSPHWTGLGMGFINYDDIPNGNIKLGKSRHFTFNLVDYHKQISKSNWLFVSGIGFEWFRYHFDSNSALTKENGTTIFKPAPEGIEYNSTKLLAYYATIPLLLEYQVSDFHISGGVVGFFKCYSKSQVKYFDDQGKHKKDMGRDLNIRPVDIKLRLQAGIKDVSIYGYYSPLSLFDKNKGPDLKTYTIGIILGI